MKHCDKSLEPDCLKDFRNGNQNSTWDEFRNHNGGKNYRDLRNTLVRDQGGLCAYCELNLRQENQQVSHFHPKSDNAVRNWALEWSNLWLSCKGGSQTWLDKSLNEYLPPLPGKP